MELGKSYFLMEMSDDDYLIVLTLAKNMGIKKEQLIMRALQTEVQRLQEEWRASQRVIKGQPSGESKTSLKGEKGEET